jgi:vancomycin aglycone glucosyltransferase
VVPHAGAGTTTTAARAGVPQVVMPRMYDQPYWAEQVNRLGIGSAATTESLATVLTHVLHPDVTARAQAVATEVRTDGARVAAKLLVG